MKMFYELPTANLTDAELMDQMRIKNLVEFERYCFDYGLKEQQRAQWFEDGKLFTTWFKGDFKDYIVSKPISHDVAYEDTDCLKETHSHRVNDTIVWLKGDKAIAEILAFLNFRTKLGWEWVDTQCWARFHYRVEKRDGKWGIVYFEGIYEKDRMDPVFSDSDFFLPRELLQKYRPINWNMAVRRDIFSGGVKNYQDWAGADKPETIQKLYEESSAWLGLE